MTGVVRLVLCSFAVAKLMMAISSLEIPSQALELIKKSDIDRERMILARTGMFFDCPVCVSIVASILVFLIEIIGLGFINSVLGLSLIGVIINKRFIRDEI